MSTSIFDIIEYLVKHNELKIFENLNVKELDKSWWDFSATLILDGQKYEGRGIDSDSTNAISKAVFECIERTLLNFNGIENSNGIAISYDVNKAMDNAKSELIERHLYLLHWQNLIPFTPIENGPTRNLSSIFHSFYPKTIDLNFWGTSELQGRRCVLCTITGPSHFPRFGVILGMSAKEDIGMAVQHSFFESYSSFSHDFRNHNLGNSLSLEAFKNLADPSFTDHGQLAKHYSYFSKFSNLFANSADATRKIETDNARTDYSFNELAIPFPFKLHALKCSSPNLLNLQTGFGLPDLKNPLPHLLD